MITTEMESSEIDFYFPHNTYYIQLRIDFIFTLKVLNERKTKKKSQLREVIYHVKKETKR